MRPDRFREFALQTYLAAGLTALPWQDGTRPNGIQVTLPSGAQVWHAIACQSADGDDLNQPEKPVERHAPDPVPLPDIPGRVTIPDAERYLAALLQNSGSKEIADAYTYSGREKPSVHPGFGVNFHSTARVFCVFVHALRPGEQNPGGEYNLPQEV
jgi:hypothetical protein